MGRVKQFKVEDALAKATDVFWQKGFEAASLSDLTEEMGIQRPSLYDTFGSKAELYRDALMAYQAGARAQLEQLLAEGTTPVDSLRRFLATAIPDSINDRKGCFCVNASIETASHEAEIQEVLQKHFAQVQTLLARYVSAGQAAGEISLDLSPMDAAGYLLTLIHGLHVTARTTADPAILTARAECGLSALLP